MTTVVFILDCYDTNIHWKNDNEYANLCKLMMFFFSFLMVLKLLRNQYYSSFFTNEEKETGRFHNLMSVFLWEEARWTLRFLYPTIFPTITILFSKSKNLVDIFPLGRKQDQ